MGQSEHESTDFCRSSERGVSPRCINVERGARYFDDFETLQEVMANKEKAEALIEFYLEADYIELLNFDELTLGPVVPNPENYLCRREL